MKTCKWCGREVENRGGDECDVCWELRMHMNHRDTDVILKILLSVMEERKAWLPKDEN